MQRDLACRDLWTDSIARSHERRVRNGAARPFAAADELLPPRPRDLTDPEPWQRSNWRSNTRRAAAAQRSELPRPSPRGLSLAALFAVAGVPAVGVASELAGQTDVAEAKGPRSTLERGDRGPRVAALQRKLGIPADGVFGKQTKRALKRYQARRGLTVDGVAGPQTLRSLGVRSRSRPASKRTSSRGGGVASMQRKLGVPADGVFGPQTERAVRKFQRRRGLGVDGVVGPQTRRALGLGGGPVLKRKGGGGATNGTRGVVARVIAAGNRIATKPYVYGGGHGSWRSAGYDCSGSISYALHGGGLLRRPLASGGFMRWGRPGRGKHITVYANAGHAFMVVNGRRFDTSARRETGSRWSNKMRSTAGYVARHPAGL